MNIDINRAACEGHGLCEQTAPAVYELDEEGYVRLKIDPITPEYNAAAESGARVCPVAALSVRR